MPYLGTVELKASDIRRIDITSSTSATHTLTWTAPNEQSLIVTINGVKQQNNYTVSGTTLTLDSALSASDLLEVIGINDIGTTITPAQGSVDTDQLANVAVTTAKLAADSETSAKIVDGTVANADMADMAANTIKVRDANSSGVPSDKALATTEILIGDGTGFTAAALSGDATMTNAGAVTVTSIADDAVTAAKLADSAYLANRNIFINGACQVNQRGNSTGQTGSAYHSVDRFYTAVSAIGTYSFSQESDGPDGFANSWKIDCTTADASPASGDLLVLQCKFEGQNLQQLKKGTASAESLTLSFWVKSYQTGNYQVNLIDNDNSRVIGTTFTISSTATWEYKTVTFAGDTTGALGDDANTSLYIEWWFDSGTDFSSGAVPTSWEALANTDRNAGGTIRLADSTSNYCQLTGIQLEIGTVATPFERKSYGQELEGCQRYYLKLGDTGGSGYATMGFATAAQSARMTTIFHFPTTMRGTPSSTYGGTLSVLYGTFRANITSQPDAQLANYGGYINYDVTGTPFTAYTYSGLIGGNGDATTYVAFDAEL